MTEHSQNIPRKTVESDAIEISNRAVLSKDPLVSVIMITYNHEPYIAQAIQGVLIQKTDFPIELIIGEDCSTDRTREIVFDYQKKYPEQIRVITSVKNVGMMNNSNRTLASCRGNYIALCEGDDYWTDPHKLQKQVDFLEDNPDFAICFHNMQIIYEGKPHLNRISNTRQKEITTINNLAYGNYIYTASCIFRNNLHEIPDWFHQCPVGDYPLHLLNAQYGRIKFIDEIMGVYRVHQGGIWENKSYSYRLEESIKMLEIIRTKFDKKINKTLNSNLYNYSYKLAIYHLMEGNIAKYKFYFSKIRGGKHFFLNMHRIIFLSLMYFLKHTRESQTPINH